MVPGHKPGMTREETVMERQEQTFDQLIDASAAALGLQIEPEWRAAIKANLAATLRLANLVAEFELPDEAEPAPVFEA
jgi:1-carboxybiuret hydrolase subunit AtzG-like protein